MGRRCSSEWDADAATLRRSRPHGLCGLRFRFQRQRPKSGPSTGPAVMDSPARSLPGGLTRRSRPQQLLRARRRGYASVSGTAGEGALMTYELVYRVGLGNAQSPFRVVAQPEGRVKREPPERVLAYYRYIMTWEYMVREFDVQDSDKILLLEE